MARCKIIIGANGEYRAVHSDPLQQFFQKLGEVQLRRASRVDAGSELRPEACEWLKQHGKPLILDQWYADMLVGTRQVLGPFATHGEAIAAEQVVLHREKIPLE